MGLLKGFAALYAIVIARNDKTISEGIFNEIRRQTLIRWVRLVSFSRRGILI